MNLRRSSMRLHSFQGIQGLPQMPVGVNHVSGMKCQLCAGKHINDLASQDEVGGGSMEPPGAEAASPKSSRSYISPSIPPIRSAIARRLHRKRPKATTLVPAEALRHARAPQRPSPRVAHSGSGISGPRGTIPVEFSALIE